MSNKKERHQQVTIADGLTPLYNKFADIARGNDDGSISVKVNGKTLTAPDNRRLFEMYKKEINEYR